MLYKTPEIDLKACIPYRHAILVTIGLLGEGGGAGVLDKNLYVLRRHRRKNVYSNTITKMFLLGTVFMDSLRGFTLPPGPRVL